MDLTSFVAASILRLMLFSLAAGVTLGFIAGLIVAAIFF